MFNTHLINNISHKISNLFHLKIKILNLDCQETCSLHFENVFSRDAPKILYIWGKFKFLEYLLNMSPFFHEHFVLNQDVFLLFKFVSLSFFVISELSLCCF